MTSIVKVKSVDNYSEPCQKVLDYVRIKIVKICNIVNSIISNLKGNGNKFMILNFI
jgi:hypothetical protein